MLQRTSFKKRAWTVGEEMKRGASFNEKAVRKGGARERGLTASVCTSAARQSGMAPGQCEIEMGKERERESDRGEQRGEFNSNFRQRAPSDDWLRTRRQTGREKGFLLLKRHHHPRQPVVARRRRVDTHKKQLICIEAEGRGWKWKRKGEDGIMSMDARGRFRLFF